MKRKYKRQLVLFLFGIAILYGFVFGLLAVKYPNQIWLSFVVMFIIFALVSFIGVKTIAKKSKNDPLL